MKLLVDILYKVPLVKLIGSTEIEITGLSIDSRSVQNGFAFIALEGSQTNGHRFLDAAITLQELPA
jgi:UDP-N-acetylmuramoyl-L-alanyl-D-glutamate--2,6-diaminopimelate ligase